MDQIFNLFYSFNFWGWFLLMFGMQYTAGPGNILVATAVGQNGFRRSVGLLTGLWIPAVVYTLVIGFGFKSIQSGMGPYFDILTLIGTLYIFYLGYTFFSSGKSTVSIENKQVLGFKDGFIVATFNGKLIVVILVMFPVALTEQSNSLTIILITILFMVNGLIAQLLWGLGGKLFSSLMGPEQLTRQNYVYGSLLIGVAVWMLYHLSLKYL